MAHGEEWAAVAFVRRYQRRVYGLAAAMLGDKGAAEDVAQEALTRAWRHAQVFDARRGRSRRGCSRSPATSRSTGSG